MSLVATNKDAHCNDNNNNKADNDSHKANFSSSIHDQQCITCIICYKPSSRINYCNLIKVGIMTISKQSIRNYQIMIKFSLKHYDIFQIFADLSKENCKVF